MVQHIEAYGRTYEFPDDMPDDKIRAAIEADNSAAGQARARLSSRGLTPADVKAGRGMTTPDQIKFLPPKVVNGGAIGGIASALKPDITSTIANAIFPGGGQMVNMYRGMLKAARGAPVGGALTAAGLPDYPEIATESYRRGGANESRSDMYGAAAVPVAMLAAGAVAPKVLPAPLRVSAERSMNAAMPGLDSSTAAAVSPELIDRGISFSTRPELEAKLIAELTPKGTSPVRLKGAAADAVAAVPEDAKPASQILKGGATRAGKLAVKGGVGAAIGAGLGRVAGGLGEAIGVSIGGMRELKQIPNVAWRTGRDVVASPGYNSSMALGKASLADLLENGGPAIQVGAAGNRFGTSQQDRYLAEAMGGSLPISQESAPATTQASKGKPVSDITQGLRQFRDGIIGGTAYGQESPDSGPYGTVPENRALVLSTPPSQLLPAKFQNARNVSLAQRIAPTKGSNGTFSSQRGDLWPGAEPDRPSTILEREMSPDDMGDVLPHELGHAIWLRDLTANEQTAFVKFMREYATSEDYNPESEVERAFRRTKPTNDVLDAGESEQKAAMEFFPEMVRLYISTPTALEQDSPRGYALMRRIFGGREYKGGKISDQ